MNKNRFGRSAKQYKAQNQETSGEAVPILSLKGDGTFELDETALALISEKNSYARDKPVVVVSVAGAFRKGKSFLLNIFLRYMRKKGQGDWLGGTNTRLEGFPWRHGSERDTTGILVWNELFLVTRPKGDQVAVLFMDTQGAFDSDASLQDCTNIFALSTITSSVQVYNLSQNIQENDLQHLHVCTEYGRIAQQQESQEKPFQKLLFLVRDWAYLSDAEHGEKGGRKILKRRLKISSQNEEHMILREQMQSHFEEIDCFLLPYPGRQVATGQAENGYLPEMEDDFKHHLQAFVASVLTGDKLVTKRINGQEIPFKNWVTYFSKHAKIFKEKQLPQIKTLIKITAEVNNMGTVEAAKKRYEDGMLLICGPDRPFMNIWDLEEHHKDLLNGALAYFDSVPKMGGEFYSQPYKAKLKQEIEEMGKQFFENNKNKSYNATAYLLGVAASLSLVGVAVATVMGGPAGVVVGVTGLMTGGTSGATLVAWCVSRATGTIRTFRQRLDSAVNYAHQRYNRWCHKTSSALQTYTHWRWDYRRLLQLFQPPYKTVTGPGPAANRHQRPG